jgi:hypothetical protein
MSDAIDEARVALADALLSFEEVALQGLDTAAAWETVMTAADRYALAVLEAAVSGLRDALRDRLEAGHAAD